MIGSVVLMLAASAVSGDVAQPSNAAVASVEDVHGVEHELAGKPAVFVFVKTGCPIANYYHPTLRRLAEGWGTSVSLIVVHTESKRSIEEIVEHRDEYDVAGVLVHDVDGELVEALDATITPEAVVLNGSGEVQYRGRIDDKYLGFGKSRQVVTSNDLANAVESVLTGRPVVPSRTKAIGCVIRSRDS